MGLEQPEFANTLGGDATGGKIRHAAAGKLHAHIRDIHLLRKNMDACGADLLGRLPGERQDDVDIVDHEIQHYVYVQAAGAEFAETVHLEEKRLGDDRIESDDRGIEPLQVADLQDASVARRGIDQLPGGLRRVGDGFFDHDIHAQLHQLASDGSMRDGGAGYHGGIGARGQVLQRRQDRAAVRSGSLGSTFAVCIEHTGQLGMLGLLNNAQVVPAEAAGSDYGDTGFR